MSGKEPAAPRAIDCTGTCHCQETACQSNPSDVKDANECLATHGAAAVAVAVGAAATSKRKNSVADEEAIKRKVAELRALRPINYAIARVGSKAAVREARDLGAGGN
jgi:hypothetical protein